MVGKTKVKVNIDSEAFGNVNEGHFYKKDEIGYIDGYVESDSLYTRAIVVIGDRIRSISYEKLTVISEEEYNRLK